MFLPRPSDKPLLDISVDFMEPLFGALGPLLVSLGVGFQLRDPVLRPHEADGKASEPYQARADYLPRPLQRPCEAIP